MAQAARACSTTMPAITDLLVSANYTTNSAGRLVLERACTDCYPGTAIPTWDALSQEDRIVLYIVFACVASFSIVWLVPFLNWILFPLKMMSVAFHELSHAIAAIISCGSLVRIELEGEWQGFGNQGGCCWTRGGSQPLIQAAGQLGSAFWASVMLFCSWDILASTIGLIICGSIWFVFLLFTSCRQKPKNYLFIIGLSVFWWVVIGVLLWVFWMQTPVRYVCCVIASGLTSYCLIREITDLLLNPISTKIGVEQTDLKKFTQSIGCGSNRCSYLLWGVVWLILSIGFVLAGGLGGLILFHSL